MLRRRFCYLFLLAISQPVSAYCDKIHSQKMNQVVNKTILRLMKKHDIPGIAVAVIHKDCTRYYTYGVIDTENNIPVTQHSLFEIGSVSKTFTGVLGGDAIARGEINLQDPASAYSPDQLSSHWNNINLLQLATYTAGGLPAKMPEEATSESSLFSLYQRWKPAWHPGARRLYSDVSIGLFGSLAVKPSGICFDEALKTRVLTPLRMNNTWAKVPEHYQHHYSWGYLDRQPVRLLTGTFSASTNGLISSANDMANWVRANMNPERIDNRTLQQGIRIAQSRYWRIGSMYQGLGWDMFNWPVDPVAITYCSHSKFTSQPQISVAITPPVPPIQSAWIHKTGSTPGFGAYVAFVPEKQLGIVLLANKNYPKADRIQSALTILNTLH